MCITTDGYLQNKNFKFWIYNNKLFTVVKNILIQGRLIWTWLLVFWLNWNDILIKLHFFQS